jgi:ribonucleotide monophosphatase NagD (HAD superfamily)
MRISGLREIARQFDGMLIDQFGVIHDGRKLYPGTIRVLSELKAAGIPVAVMTNSGKRAAANRERLVRMGVPRDFFVGAVSSGEVAYRALAHFDLGPDRHPAPRHPSESWGPASGEGKRDASLRWHDGNDPVKAAESSVIHKAFLIGKDGEDYGFEGIEFTRDPAEAEIMLILGSNAPRTSLEDYRRLFAGIRLPALCCNPDRLMLTPDGLVPAPGAIAAIYEEMGGKVTWIGKPYPEIYREAARLIGNPPRILCIGDSPEHDVAGGRNAGFWTLLVLQGVSAGRDAAGLSPQPDFVMDSFVW